MQSIPFGLDRLTVRQATLLLALAFSLEILLPLNVLEANLLEEDYTLVYIEGYLPYKTTSLTSPHISVGGDSNIGGPTFFDFTANAPVNWSPAEVHGTGYAEMGTLKAKINFSGPSARQASIRSRYHDIFTVVVPGMTTGTPGTMTFAYHVDGIADAIGVSGQTIDDDFSVATVSVRMSKYISDGGTPPSPVYEAIGTQSFEVLGSQGFGGTLVNNIDFTFDRLLTFEVPFEYGVPVALETELAITLLTDTDFIQSLSNPYGEIWGGGVIENIYVDTYNTAKLIAIVNEEHPDSTVNGVNFDYSPLVMASIPPILEPGDFDGDGDVDGADFLTWQRNPNVGSFSDWQTNYGMVSPLGIATAVPEPSTWMMLFIVAVGSKLTGRRRIISLVSRTH